MQSKHNVGMYGEIKLYAGTSCPDLAEKIANYLEKDLCGRDIISFPNDNLFVKLHSVRGQDCYVIQTTSAPTHRNLMELLITIQTLRLDSAARITAVVPYLCYGRSDKKDQPRVPITARLVADMIEVAGADRYMTLDPHAGQVQGFFSIPGDVLTASHMIIDYINANIRAQLQKPVVIATDLGFAKKGTQLCGGYGYAHRLYRKATAGNDAKAEALTLIGDVKDRDVIIVDDEVDTGGSIVQAVNSRQRDMAQGCLLVFIHAGLTANAAEEAGCPSRSRDSSLPIPFPSPNPKGCILGNRIDGASDRLR